MTPAQDPFYIVKDEIQDSVSCCSPAAPTPHCSIRPLVSSLASATVLFDAELLIRENLPPFLVNVMVIPVYFSWDRFFLW
jgi:hypothetical protein